MYFVPCLSSSCFTCAPSWASCSSDTRALATPGVAQATTATTQLSTSAGTNVLDMKPSPGWMLPLRPTRTRRPPRRHSRRPPLPSGQDRGEPRHTMARPYWKGAISFGLVNVPVALTPATRRLDFSFHLYHDEDGGRIREKRVCERDGKEVPWQHIVKGYELSKTQVVTLSQEELRAADPERDRTIGIEEFVKLEEIDPLQVDGSYYVSPDGRSAKAYALLAQALEKSEQVAIARIVLSTKQHLCMLRSTEGHMVLTTLVWADEVREAPEVPRESTG